MKSGFNSQLYVSPTWLLIVPLVSLCACVSGCGGPPSADYGSLGLVEISGAVTLEDQPLPGASIQFVDTDQTYCSGVTDSAGRYTMMLDSRRSGVIPGDKTVRISSRLPASEANGAAEEEDPDAKLKSAEKVPDCYNKNSILKIKVTTLDSAMDFDLKTDCSTTTFK